MTRAELAELADQASSTLTRHMALAAQYGDAEYAEACRAEIARREQGPEHVRRAA